ncbi:MAG: histidine kinase [Myxococcota bacterium]
MTPTARFALAQVVGWSALAAVVYGASATYLMSTAGASVGQVVVRAGLWAALGIGLSTALLVPYRRFFADGTPTPARLAAIGAIAVATGITFALLFDASVWPLPEAGMEALRAARTKAAWSRAISPSLAMVAWSATWIGLVNATRLRAERERALRAEALAVEARLAMLRYELNPHFLFNALNSIVGAIDESPDNAKDMVRQLAELLRHTLHRPDGASTVADELHAARLYLALEQARFEDRLAVELTVSPDADGWRVPAMIVQPLVENAVKHGMRTGPVPLRVTVDARVVDDRLAVTVTNTGRLEPLGTGVGLRNLRDRLVHLDGATFALDQRGDRVVAALGVGR